MKKYFSQILFYSMLLFFPIDINAQIDIDHLGIEGQVYPTGYLIGIKVELSLGDRHGGEFKTGLNIFDHKGFGVQDAEKGDGFGFTLGYRYYFSLDKTKWLIGVRNDFWWNTVDWKSFNTGIITEGTSKIFVIQPTAILGYVWVLGNHFDITASTAFGFEINAQTAGEPTGEGAILLGGIAMAYKF